MNKIPRKGLNGARLKKWALRAEGVLERCGAEKKST